MLIFSILILVFKILSNLSNLFIPVYLYFIKLSDSSNSCCFKQFLLIINIIIIIMLIF